MDGIREVVEGSDQARMAVTTAEEEVEVEVEEKVAEAHYQIIRATNVVDQFIGHVTVRNQQPTTQVIC